MRTRPRLSFLFLVAACADSSPSGHPSSTPDAQPSLPSEDAAPESQRDASADAGEVASEDGRELPCDIAAILDRHCGLCHGAKSVYGAPMSLRKHADFHAQSIEQPGALIHQRVAKRLHEEGDPMPPAGHAPLSPADLAIVDEWLAQGAPRSDAPCAPSSDAGVEKEPPFDWTQCDYDFELRAHAGQTADDATPYAVPLSDDHYECFTFAVPWDVEVHGLRFEPIVDQPRVVHHWLLYELSSFGAPPSGSHGKCGLNRSFLATWTPGAGADRLPDDVGMQMPVPSSMLQLELHYNNVRRLADVADRSGVRVCATKQLRTRSASVHKVGSSDITLEPGKITKVVNTCTVASGVGDAHVISAFPHMHQLGRHFKTTVRRKDGTVETLTDTPFDFRYQGYTPTPFVIHQGDVITTTCTYENDTGAVVRAGEGTDEEMCYNHLLAWPPRSIANLPLGKDCIGLVPSDLH